MSRLVGPDHSQSSPTPPPPASAHSLLADRKLPRPLVSITLSIPRPGAPHLGTYTAGWDSAGGGSHRLWHGLASCRTQCVCSRAQGGAGRGGVQRRRQTIQHDDAQDGFPSLRCFSASSPREPHQGRSPRPGLGGPVRCWWAALSACLSAPGGVLPATGLARLARGGQRDCLRPLPSNKHPRR